MARADHTFSAAIDQFKNEIARGITVEAAASATGFRPALYIRFQIGTLRRNANVQIDFSDAASDLPGDGSAMAILLVAKARTKDRTLFHVVAAGAAKPDFARQFLPGDVVARDVDFSGLFSCKAGEPIDVAFMTPSRTYFVRSGVCP
jgi:hypothetical protein